jgi:phosphate transport system substrate-binding protein
MRRSTRGFGLVAGVLALALLGAACGDDSDSDSADTTADAGAATSADGASTSASAGGDLSGDIVVSGSSTVEPISVAVGRLFANANPAVAIQVDGPGTGDGFAKFCAGETDISDASRPIRAEEVETCEAGGVEFIELKVAIDGLSVITSTNNADVECLAFSDLYALLGPDATGVDNWSGATEAAEANAGTLGDEFGATHAPYPDAPLTVTGPGEESGTFDSFVEIVIAPVGEALGVEDATVRPDYTASPNDNVIIEGIAQNDTSLGWVGFAFVEENLDTIKPLQVDGGAGCVEPTTETIADGSYPIARDLYIYVNAAKAEENAAVAGYVDFYLSEEGLAVIGPDVDAGQVPYVPLASADIEATRAVWEARETGTRDGGN